MNYSAEHKFWQRRVEKEAAARKKYVLNKIISYRYIEGVVSND